VTAAWSDESEFGEILAIAFGVESHQSVRMQQGMRCDHEIYEQTLWRIPSRAPPAVGVGREALA